MFTKPSTTGMLLAFANLATCFMGAHIIKYVFNWFAMGNDFTYGACVLLIVGTFMAITPYIALFCKD